MLMLDDGYMGFIIPHHPLVTSFKFFSNKKKQQHCFRDQNIRV